MDDQRLDAYARLAVQVGVNVQRGQTLLVRCPVECADFGRRVVRAAYDAGARDVVMLWNDDICSREHWLRAASSVFDETYPWDVLRNETLAKQGAAFLTISGTDPDNLRGVDPDRLRRASAATGRDLREFYRLMMANRFAWSIVSVPTQTWAQRVFPGCPDAMERLWEAILSVVRVTKGNDPVQAWRAHCDRLRDMAARLNARRFVALHYRNALGTDLRVGLPQGHVWIAGDEQTPSGVRFVANMPTEEVFSAPQRDAVDGILVASRPLSLDGNIIEGIRLTLRQGRIVKATATQGDDILQNALNTDEGARYLGEVALVPADSPISRSGVLFFDTLFDENAACHFAFGQAYPGCVEGGEEMDEAELLARGVNAVSDTHVDFMVGTDDLCVTGITAEGEHVPVLQNGCFVL